MSLGVGFIAMSVAVSVPVASNTLTSTVTAAVTGSSVVTAAGAVDVKATDSGVITAQVVAVSVAIAAGLAGVSVAGQRRRRDERPRRHVGATIDELEGPRPGHGATRRRRDAAVDHGRRGGRRRGGRRGRGFGGAVAAGGRLTTNHLHGVATALVSNTLVSQGKGVFAGTDVHVTADDAELDPLEATAASVSVAFGLGGAVAARSPPPSR